MKKTVLARSLLGFPLGVFIAQTLLIIISLIQGAYTPVEIHLVQQMGVLPAVILQYVLSGILGAAFGGASCIWVMQDWSLLKQTSLHFAVSVVAMFPIGWLNWWMPHNIIGALIYIAIFVAIYVVIYTVCFFVWKNKIQKMDARIQKERTFAEEEI